MKASVLDLRKNMRSVLAALNRRERITLTYRGRKKAEIIPDTSEKGKILVSSHPAFGMWAGRQDLKKVDQFVRELRQGRG